MFSRASCFGSHYQSVENYVILIQPVFQKILILKKIVPEGKTIWSQFYNTDESYANMVIQNQYG